MSPIDRFATPVIPLRDQKYRVVRKGAGATRYVIGDVELLSLVRSAEKLKVIEEFLQEYKSKDHNTQALLAFLDQGKPLPRKP